MEGIRETLASWFDTDDDGKTQLMHDLYDAPKLFNRRPTGKVSRRARDAWLKIQASNDKRVLVTNERPLQMPRQTPSDAAEAEKAIRDDQENSSIKQANSFVARGLPGKAAKALERAFVKPLNRDDAVSKLRDLHPHGDNPPPPPSTEKMFVRIEPQTLRDRLKRSKKGASPGPNGWTEELMLPLMEDAHCAAVLADLATRIANNDIHDTFRRRLTSCRLVGVPKPGNGIRPVAVGDCLLKAVTAIAMDEMKTQVRDHFGDLQLGILRQGGAEEIVHAIKDTLNLSPDMNLVTFDGKNAFNSVYRDKGFAPVVHDKKWQSLWNLFQLEYGEASDLHFHDNDGSDPVIIKSQRGCRQGSTLGSFYFALSIHPVLLRAKELFPDVKIWAYIDDISCLSTDAEQLKQCIQFIADQLAELGLDCNEAKCEWYGNAWPVVELDQSCIASKFNHRERKIAEAAAAGTEAVTKIDGVKILGCYISNDDRWASDQLVAKMKKHDVFFTRLRKVNKYTAAVLLNVCGIPRMSYYARVHCPTVFQEAADSFDKLVEDTWSHIAECEPDATSRLVAKLPTRLGGCGFTRYQDIAEAAYTASYKAATADGPITPDQTQHGLVHAIMSGLRDQHTADDNALFCHLEETKRGKTNAWLRTGCKDATDEGFSAFMRNRMMAISKLQVGKPVSTCPGCHNSFPARQWRAHVAGCVIVKGWNATVRHNIVRDTCALACHDEGIQCDSEEPREFKSATCPGCGDCFPASTIKRHVSTCSKIPAHVDRTTLRPHRSGPDFRAYVKGKCHVADFTMISPLAKTYLDSNKTLADFIKDRENEKNFKYKKMVEQHSFGKFPSLFHVVTFTIYGTPSAGACAFVNALADNDGQKAARIMTRLQQAVMMATGECIHNAELQQGLAPPTAAPAPAPPRPSAALKHLTQNFSFPVEPSGSAQPPRQPAPPAATAPPAVMQVPLSSHPNMAPTADVDDVRPLDVAAAAPTRDTPPATTEVAINTDPISEQTSTSNAATAPAVEPPVRPLRPPPASRHSASPDAAEPAEDATISSTCGYNHAMHRSQSHDEESVPPLKQVSTSPSLSSTRPCVDEAADVQEEKQTVAFSSKFFALSVTLLSVVYFALHSLVLRDAFVSNLLQLATSTLSMIGSLAEYFIGSWVPLAPPVLRAVTPPLSIFALSVFFFDCFLPSRFANRKRELGCAVFSLYISFLAMNTIGQIQATS